MYQENNSEDNQNFSGSNQTTQAETTQAETTQPEMTQEETTYSENTRTEETQTAEPQYISRENEKSNYAVLDKLKQKNQPNIWLMLLISAIIGSLIGSTTMYFAIPFMVSNKMIPSYSNGGGQIIINSGSIETVAKAVAIKATASVVRISSVVISDNGFFGSNESEGVGSGLVVSSDGLLLTNAHVVGTDPKKLTVNFSDGTDLPGKVLWSDSALDLAVVKVNAKGLVAATLGDSDKVSIGDVAIAIGNPLGTQFERSVTQGIISGSNRTISVNQNELMEDLIQTDAAINPGNSGGPLLNARGEVIGINTVKASAEGLGFAIPINIAKPIINQIVKTGKFVKNYIGITALDREMASYYEGQLGNIKVTKGLYIYSLTPDSEAGKAGLKAGDVITKIDGMEINTLVKFRTILYSKNPGDKIKITYERKGVEKTVEVGIMTDGPKA